MIDKFKSCLQDYRRENIFFFFGFDPHRSVFYDVGGRGRGGGGGEFVTHVRAHGFHESNQRDVDANNENLNDE